MAEDRLQKILANAGYCSRREAEKLVEQGAVSVDGRIATLGDKADPDKQEIRVFNERLKFEAKRYLAFNKPRNVLTTLADPSGKPDITAFLTVKERVFPVGRLDYDAEGLLIITNDGDFANRIMHPRYEKTKTYQAVVDKEVTAADIARITGKTELRDGVVTVHEARKIHRMGIRLVIHEGKNHVVKRLLRKHGFYVKGLKRVAVGPVQLGDLKSGQMRPLTKEEIAALNA